MTGNAWLESRARLRRKRRLLGRSGGLKCGIARTQQEFRSKKLSDSAGSDLARTAGRESLQVDGKTLVTRKGSNERIRGVDVKFSTDLE